MYSLERFLEQESIPHNKSFGGSLYNQNDVAEAILGRKLRDDEVVHHIDRFKSNNEPSNLCVMSIDDHRHYHNWHRWMENNRPEIELSNQYLRKVLKQRWDCIMLA